MDRPEPAGPPATASPPRHGLRGLFDRLRGVPPSQGPAAPASVTPRPDIPNRIGRYAVSGRLGEGGMGVVYAARDELLGRSVAVKVLALLANDEAGRKRFWREARAAASVNHPNVCQLYEIGEDGGQLFMAMELLQGESLSERLGRGAMTVHEAVPIGLEMLAALAALHALGFVHRDVKPSNVFLTPHGVKLLDFGLARPIDAGAVQIVGADSDATRTGLVLGTPRYMSPEQITGEALDARSDLFAVGAVLFQMLAGRPAFEGRNTVEILHATLHEQPPALTGSPAVVAADRVIRRALAKRPSDRPPSAEVMAQELRGVQASSGGTAALARPLTRLVVLPFRILRSDPETDFLAFSLPDAIATSLSGIEPLVVRSSASAARFDRESPDLKAVAAEADVDLVVLGSVLRSGDELRVAVQLVDAPAGTLVASHSVQSSLGDLFHLQDDVAQRVVDALSLSLARPADKPRSAQAYEFYLRGNDLARQYDQLPLARDMYLRCVEEDPGFAPAWAQLGRSYFVIGKYIEDAAGNYSRSEEALHRALEISPDLSAAHRIYAHLEADLGRAPQAMVRLLGLAARRGNDAELFAGLVHVCRYCGLFEQSVAAHEEARRLDPHVTTSIEMTFFTMCEFERLLATSHNDDPMRAIALVLLGRREEARLALLEAKGASTIPAFQMWIDWLLAWIDKRRGDMLALAAQMDQRTDLRVVLDPESLFMEGWMLCEAGELERGIARLGRGVAAGYLAASTLVQSPHFDAMRGEAAFEEALRTAEAGCRDALRAFRGAGGERLLGR